MTNNEEYLDGKTREEIQKEIDDASYESDEAYCPQCKKKIGGFGPKYHDQDHMCWDCHKKLWNGEFAKK